MNQLAKIKVKYGMFSVVKRATLWFLVCSIIQKSISLVTTPIFTRVLNESEYGLYSTYLSWLNIFMVIVTMRLEAGTFNKGMSKYKDRRDEYTTAMQGLTFLLTSIMLIIYLTFSKLINDFTELPTILMLAMFIEIYCVPAYNFWIRRMRYDYKYHSVILVTMAQALVNPVLGLVFVYLTNGNKGEARIWSVVVTQAIFGICLFVYNLKKCNKLINPELWRYAFLFNLPLLPHYISIYILQHSDRIMIQKICGLSDVALYSVVYNFSMILNIVIDSLNHTLIPWLYTELENKDFRNIRKKLNKIVLCTCGMLIGFIIFAPELVGILAPSSYFNAVYVVPPVTASLLFIFLYNVFCNIEYYYEYNKMSMFVSVGGALLNLLLNWIFIPRYGFVAAGYTTMFSYAAFLMAHYIFVAWISKRKVGSQIISGKLLWGEIVLFALAAIALSCLYPYRLLRYSIILLALLGMLLYRKKLIALLKNITSNGGIKL